MYTTMPPAVPGDVSISSETHAESSKPKVKPKVKPKITQRVAGESLLPTSRVQKIIKADKEMAGVAKEALHLISVATEEFIKRLSQAAHQQATREKRTTVQYRDMATAVLRNDELTFLEEIIPQTISAPAALLKRRIKEKEPVGEYDTSQTLEAAFERKGKGKGRPSVTNGTAAAGRSGASTPNMMGVEAEGGLEYESSRGSSAVAGTKVSEPEEDEGGDSMDTSR